MKLKRFLLTAFFGIATLQAQATEWTLGDWYMVSSGQDAVVRSEAINLCESLGLKGINWRLPTRNEFNDALTNKDADFMNVLNNIKFKQSMGFLDDTDANVWFYNRVEQDGNTLYPLLSDTFRGQVLCTSKSE
ncbi:hypothetical protein GNP63_14320 [Aliivibrio fischeri]|uniref:hypothetical protein n=1 Tax=Aliivibrio fischeri TaxID=668 RepID=UPI0012D89F8B|nr:hypothetical protein [Aliivibrio fischeri]MUH97707.1 hypothetical protein [Aliivibrio fischeri]MUI62390.1 hypothetical protein [Aliivibrio fischeri]